jgi:hypothetical protein
VSDTRGVFEMQHEKVKDDQATRGHAWGTLWSLLLAPTESPSANMEAEEG